MSEPRLAESTTERLRRSLLRRYGDDADFGAALEALYRDHCQKLPADLARREPDVLRNAIAAHYGEVLTEPATEPLFSRLDIGDIDQLTWRDPLTNVLDHPSAAAWATAYLAAVRELAERFGLHRLDPRTYERSFSTGEAIVHRWCQARARSGPTVDASWIVLCIMPWAGFLPPREQAVVIRWDPRTEDREAAKQRGYRQVRDALATIDKGWRGFDRDRNPKEERDLDRLYLKVRHGCTYQQIAERSGLTPAELTSDPGPNAVRKAIVRMAKAKRLDIDRTGW